MCYSVAGTPSNKSDIFFPAWRACRAWLMTAVAGRRGASAMKCTLIVSGNLGISFPGEIGLWFKFSPFLMADGQRQSDVASPQRGNNPDSWFSDWEIQLNIKIERGRHHCTLSINHMMPKADPGPKRAELATPSFTYCLIFRIDFLNEPERLAARAVSHSTCWPHKVPCCWGQTKR